MSPIQMGLQDAHPYVRRTAVMGVLKVYHLDKAAVRNAGPQDLAADQGVPPCFLPSPCWTPLHALLAPSSACCRLHLTVVERTLQALCS